MKKYCFILLLMFLIVTSVSAQSGSSIYDNIMNGNTPRYGEGYDVSTVQVAQDYSWLTKRWVDAYGNCLIKGNISYKSGDKIYHIPGWKDYKATKINTSYGERWFCTEWEAYQAGWRAPYYANRPKVYPNPYGN